MNKVGAALLQKTFHKDALYNGRQVSVLILCFLQITHIAVAAAAAAAAAVAAEGPREAASLYRCPVHLAKAKKSRQLSQRVRGGLTGVHPEWKYGGVSIKC